MALGRYGEIVSIRFKREVSANKVIIEPVRNWKKFQSALNAKCPPMYFPPRSERTVKVSIRFKREVSANEEEELSHFSARVFQSALNAKCPPINITEIISGGDPLIVSIRFKREVSANLLSTVL